MTRQAVPGLTSSKRRGGVIGAPGADAVLGAGPGHVLQQPAARRGGVEIHVQHFRHAYRADQAVFQRERTAIGAVQAADGQQLVAARQRHLFGGLRARRPIGPLQQLVAVNVAACAHGHGDIRNFQRHLLQVRRLPGHERTGAAAALDHAAFGQRGQHLVHGHPRAAVLLHQLVLIGMRNPGSHCPLRMRLSRSARMRWLRVSAFLPVTRESWMGATGTQPADNNVCNARAKRAATASRCR